MAVSGSDQAAPWHMWVLGVLLLLNSGVGVVDFVLSMVGFEPYLATFPEETLAYYDSVPGWVYIMWGIAAFGGVISAILLLMRRAAAIPVFALGWVTTAIAAVYTLLDPPPTGGSLFLAAFVAVALLVLVYMRWLGRRGVLR